MHVHVHVHNVQIAIVCEHTEVGEEVTLLCHCQLQFDTMYMFALRMMLILWKLWKGLKILLKHSKQ